MSRPGCHRAARLSGGSSTERASRSQVPTSAWSTTTCKASPTSRFPRAGGCRPITRQNAINAPTPISRRGTPSPSRRPRVKTAGSGFAAWCRGRNSTSRSSLTRPAVGRDRSHPITAAKKLLLETVPLGWTSPGSWRRTNPAGGAARRPLSKDIGFAAVSEPLSTGDRQSKPFDPVLGTLPARSRAIVLPGGGPASQLLNAMRKCAQRYYFGILWKILSPFWIVSSGRISCPLQRRCTFEI